MSGIELLRFKQTYQSYSIIGEMEKERSGRILIESCHDFIF